MLLFLEKLESADTYIFLAAINALSELSYWRTDPYLHRMIDLFINWKDRKKFCANKVQNLIENVKNDKTEKNFFANNNSHTKKIIKRNRDSELIFRGKVGESLAKVAKQLGFNFFLFNDTCD